MSDFSFTISIPLDDDMFLRRECPYCKKQFKIKLEKGELNKSIQDLVDNFLLEDSDKHEEDERCEDVEYYCPYCSEIAASTDWWTEEQLNYSRIFIENYMNKMINETFIKEMEKMSRNNSSISFKGEKLIMKELWISPEENDMDMFILECCDDKIKIDEEYRGEIYCHFCGFKYM